MPSPDMPDSLVLKPGRVRPVLVLLAVAGLWCFLFVLLLVTNDGKWLFGFLPMAISTAGMFLPSMLGAPPALRGDTLVDARGVTRRRGRSEIHVPWDQVARVTFMIGPPWTGHKLMLFRRQGRPIVLAAPSVGALASRGRLAALLEPVYARAGAHRPRVSERPVVPMSRIPMIIVDGLVLTMLSGIAAFALYVADPATEAWWPGRDEASRLPDACSVIDPTTISRLGLKARPAEPDTARFPRDRSCSWGTDDPPPEMSVRLELQEDLPNGASEQAHGSYLYRARDCSSAISGLGDEACVDLEEREESTRARIVARRGNVLVTVSYRADQPEDRVTAETVSAARAAIGRIRFE